MIFTRALFARLGATLSKIHLVDKCLIVYMLVLLLQSSYTLFAHNSINSEASQIDVIIRTSIAGIFGYFLSANFLRHADGIATPPPSLPAAVPEPTPSIPQPQNDAAASANDTRSHSNSTASQLQIVVATGIGLFCLLVLIILRNIPNLGNSITATPSAFATVTQFRDLISGCIGFLIGCPTTRAR